MSRRSYTIGLTAAGTRDVTALALGHLRESDRGSDGDREVVEAEAAHQLVRVRVNLQGSDRRVEGGHLGHVLVLALTLLLLELERDAAHGAALNPLHQVGREAGDLVAQALRGDNGDLINDLLVRVEVHRVEARVVLLNENASGALGGLGADATL